MVPNQSTEIPQALDGVQDELKKSISESVLADIAGEFSQAQRSFPLVAMSGSPDYYAVSKAAFIFTVAQQDA